MRTHQTCLLMAVLAAAMPAQGQAPPDGAPAPAPVAYDSAARLTVATPDFSMPHIELAPPPGWEAVDSSALEDMRGGSGIGDGLIVALGIERLVSINGELVASTRFNLSASEGLGGDAADAARNALNSGGLIQNGPGNIAPAVLSSDVLGATIIQNTLNDQTIRSQTIINASVNSATLMQSLNFNDSLGQAIRDAVRLH